ncbi:MAG: DMT family transporter [Planctomycetes bacterium]|nr:DMT family transporter [Planctomycetota bacterium]
MAYLYLSLSVLFSVMFGQCLRLGQRFGTGVLTVGAANYVVAAAISFAWFFFSTPDIHEEVWQGGRVLAFASVINGTCYFLNMLLLLAAFRYAGVGVTVAVSSSGVLVTMLASWLFRKAAMSPELLFAIFMMVPTMFLFRPREHRESTQTSFRGDLALVGCFFLNGIILEVHRWANRSLPVHALDAYQAILFTVAAVEACAYVLIKRIRIAPADLGVGVLLGIFNALATLFIFQTLTQMRSIVFFPILSCLTIVGNTVVARALWKERPSRKQYVGLASAMLIVVLLYRSDWRRQSLIAPAGQTQPAQVAPAPTNDTP